MSTRPPAKGERWFSMGLYQPIYLSVEDCLKCYKVQSKELA